MPDYNYSLKLKKAKPSQQVKKEGTKRRFNNKNKIKSQKVKPIRYVEENIIEIISKLELSISFIII